MSRIHCVQSWVGDYSGEQLGNRLSKSVEFKTERQKHSANNPATWEGINLFLPDGMANIHAFSDEAIAERNSTSTSFPKLAKPTPVKKDGLNVLHHMKHVDKQGLHECLFFQEDDEKIYILHTLNGVAKYEKRLYSDGYSVLPGEHRLEALDNRELACWRLYKRGEFTEKDWLEEKEKIDKQREREHHIYEKMFKH